MSGLINLIKSIFGGILSFIGGLLGSKKPALASDNAPKTRKSAGYFLELDEAASAPVTRQPDTQKASETQNSAAPVAVAEKPEVTSAPAEQASKKAELAVTNGASTAATAVQTAPVVVVPKEPQSAEFATKYLVPTSNGSRRRPGANMNSYLDMARNMKAGNN
jgi:predicted lipid-binding transport protein (Tim44 family)